MALTRKFLSALGVEDEKVDEIINAHTETVNGLKEEIDKYKADAEKLPAVQKELNDAKEAFANGDKSPYKVKYEAIIEEKEELQKQFEDFKNEIETQKAKELKADAYKKLLKETGVNEKRIDAILKVTDINAVELETDGTLKDIEKLTESIKSEWSDFIVTQSEQGAVVANPPQNTGGGTVRTKEDIMKITDTAERQKAWTEFLENERKK